MADNTVSPAQAQDNKEQGIVIQNIVIRPVQRRSLDVEKWRSALRAAEAIIPQRVDLYDQYADIILDSFLSSLIEKRIMGVTKRRLAFVDAQGKEVEAMTELIGSQQFRLLRREIMQQKFWGISVIEVDKTDEGGIKVFSVPRKHIKGYLGIISYEQFGVNGIQYTEPPYDKYVFQVGKNSDLGLLLKAAPYVLYKRGRIADFSNYAELFGTPFRVAKYDGFNNQVRVQLEQAMERYGGSGFAVIPKEATIDIIDSKNAAANGNLYDTLRKACNEELSVLILGETETTTSSDSSGYAQSEIHSEVEDALNENDCEDELGIFNEQVKPILANLGFPVANGNFIHEAEKEQLSLLNKATMLNTLRNQVKLPISDDYVYDEFSIPMPDNYDELKEQMQQQASPQPAPFGEGDGNSGNTPPSEEQGEAAPKKSGKGQKNAKQSKAKSNVQLSAWDKLRSRLIDFFDQAPRD